jgi:hypothetical protein
MHQYARPSVLRPVIQDFTGGGSLAELLTGQNLNFPELPFCKLREVSASHLRQS